MPATSRVIVRDGMAQFFGGTTFDPIAKAYRGNGPLASAGLSSVRAYTPKKASDRDYTIEQLPGRGMGAFMVIELMEDQEIRRAKPAGSGRKRITYATTLACFHLAEEAYAETAEQDVDELTDAIKDLIHGDVSLGGICYQAGENEAGITTRIDKSVDWNDRTATSFQISFDTEIEIVA